MDEQEEFEFRLRLEKEREQPAPPNLPGVPSVVRPQAAKGAGLAPIDPANWTKTARDTVLGLGETGLALGSGALASPYAGLVGLSSALRSGKYGTQEGVKIASDTALRSMEANTYAPRTATGREYLENTGKVLQEALPMIGLGGEMATIARASKTAVPAVTDAAKAAASKTAAAVLPTIDPEMARLARVAIKNEIPLRPDMLADSKLGKAVGGFLEHDIPLAGSKEASRTAAYNKALVRQIGGDTTKGKLTSQVYNDAMTYNGKKIGEIAGKTAIPDPAPLLEKAAVIVDDARGYGADTYRLVKSKAETLRGLVKDGVVNGDEFQKWNSKMLRDMRATNDGIKKQVLGELQDVAMDTFEAYIDPKQLPEWKTVRKQYAIGRQIQPSVAESLTGDLSPSSVMRDMLRGEDAKHRVAYGFGGEASDIAKVGKLFVEEPGLKTSIPERYVAYRGLGALGLGGGVGYAAGTGGALPAVAGATSLYSLANLYNRLGPAAARALAKDRSAGLFPLIEGP